MTDLSGVLGLSATVTLLLMALTAQCRARAGLTISEHPPTMTERDEIFVGFRWWGWVAIHGAFFLSAFGIRPTLDFDRWPLSRSIITRPAEA